MASESIPESILIVGAGLAGACAAFRWSAEAEVTVLEAETPAAGASGAAAGLVNPLMGRKANPVWRLHEALDAVPAILEAAGVPHLFRGGGLLRPAVEAKQVGFFQDAVAEHPDLATWLPEAAVHERFPDVQTAGGAMLLPRGGAIDVGRMVRALLDAAADRGATLHTGVRATAWGEANGQAWVETTQNGTTARRTADRVLLCLGQGYPGHPSLEALDLEGIKGQTVRVRRPPESGTGPLLPMSGRGYVVPEPDGTLVLGSSYDHDFDDLQPDPGQTRYIQEKTARMLPGVDDAEVLDVKVGVRVKHRSTNLPLLGPMPGRERVWVFTALGSKGLLTAPLLARDLPAYVRDPGRIPEAVRVPTA